MHVAMSSAHRPIVYRGVITQDLTKVHAVNTSDVDEGDAIHWRKYEVIAEALAPISLYQSRQNPFATLPGSSAAKSLLFDCPRLDEDGLYDRSKQLEPDATTHMHMQMQMHLPTASSLNSESVSAMHRGV